MNGMAASDKIFRLLDLEETKPEITESFPSGHTIRCSGLSFSYEPDREILHSVDLTFPQGSFTALVGESGCGKSTLASILMGRNKGYTRSVSVGGVPLSSIQEESLLRNITYISHQSYLFKGTVRENLLMGKPGASDEELWAVLSRVNLAEFLKAEQGLDTRLLEKASNLSGGQCQRLALARALCMTALSIFLMKPPPTSMWRAKTILCVKFMNWQKQNGNPRFPPACQCSGRRPYLCAGSRNRCGKRFT